MFSNILNKRVFIGHEEVRIIEYLVKQIPEIAQLYRERAQHKKALIERSPTVFDMSYAITGLDWLFSNVAQDSSILVCSLDSNITSEIEIFNILMTCPSSVHLEWLLGHLILDACLVNQSESFKKSSRLEVSDSK